MAGVEQLVVDPASVTAVEGIAEQGVTDGGKVDPDLVSPTGVEANANAGPIVALVLNPILGQSLLAIVSHHSANLAGHPGDRLVNCSVISGKVTANQGRVLFHHLVLLDLLTDHT